MVAKCLREVDAVVHLGAKVGLGVGIEDMDHYVSSNDLGTAVLLRAMAATGIVRFVQASSMVVYGERRYTYEMHVPNRRAPEREKDCCRGVVSLPAPSAGSTCHRAW